MGEQKQGWRRVKFGEVVNLVSDRCDPVSSGIERFVGLEHLEPGDLRVRSWGEVADGTTFTNRFRPGQVLFGKRRAYQRKVAVADFEGVCSGDIYVLESADPGRLLPELLPFICQTDAFLEHAVGTSAGSLSPRTHWTSLAGYEFVLPPLEEQRRLVKLLVATGEVMESLDVARKKADDVCRAIADTHFSTRNGPSVAIEDAAILVTKGESPNWQGFGYVESGIPFITSENVLWGVIDLSSPKYIPSEFHAKLARSQLRPGDVLVNIVGASIGRAAVVPPHIAEGNTNQAVAVVRLDSARLLPEYFCQWFLSSGAQRRIRSQQVNTARANVSLGDIRSLQVPMPSVAEQQALVERIAACRAGEGGLLRRAEVLRQLRNQIMLESL